MNLTLSASYDNDTKLCSQNEAQPTRKNVNGMMYPSSATYALKRRLIVPKWWVESVILTLGKKYTWYDSFITDHFNKRVYEYCRITSINIFFMIFFWDELIRQIFKTQNQKTKKIRIDLTKFLIGTEHQNASILSKIEENLIKPIRIFKIQQVDDTKTAKLIKNGYLNIFKKINLVQDVHGIWLTVHFAQNPFNIFSSPNIKSKKQLFKNSFITINPNLFYAMGSRINLQKSLNGLFLEYNKQNETLEECTHTAFNIKTETLQTFHKHVLSTVKTLYNHGILSISNIPPPMKISNIQKRQKSVAPTEQLPITFCWNLSSQTKEAVKFERMLSEQLNEIRQQKSKKQLFHEPPRDELQIVRISHSKETTKNEVDHVPVKDNLEQTYAQLPKVENTFKYPTAPKPNFHKFSDHELTIYITRFYETLNPKQKKMFESERYSMTKDQFRSFMIPILQRTHTNLPIECNSC